MSGINNNTYNKKPKFAIDMIDLTETTDNLENCSMTTPERKWTDNFPRKGSNARMSSGSRAPPKAPKKKYNSNLDNFDKKFNNYSPFKSSYNFENSQTVAYESDSDSDYDSYADFHVAKKIRGNNGESIPVVYDVDDTITYESTEETDDIAADKLESELDLLVIGSKRKADESDLGNKSFEYIPNEDETAFFQDLDDTLMVDISSSSDSEINDNDEEDDPDFKSSQSLSNWWNDHEEEKGSK